MFSKEKNDLSAPYLGETRRMNKALQSVALYSLIKRLSDYVADHYSGDDFRHPYPLQAKQADLSARRPVSGAISHLKKPDKTAFEKPEQETAESDSYSVPEHAGRASLSSGGETYATMLSLPDEEEEDEEKRKEEYDLPVFAIADTGDDDYPKFPFDPAFRLRELDRSFGETILDLIKEKGMSPITFYNRANISRQLYHRITTQFDKPPKKHIALACAVALKLDLDETRALLEKAGYALSHSDLTDVIVEAFITNRFYDIFTINEYLYEYDRGTLGSGMD